MKERPILFNVPMVRAILEGRKTQTRRVVNPQPPYSGLISKGYGDFILEKWPEQPREFGNFGRCQNIQCPYGKPGDQLWVREEHYRYGHWEPVLGVRTKKGRQKWRFVADSCEVRFDAPESFRRGRHHKDPSTPAWHKRLARFMPRAFSRITLEIVSIRAERLQEIGPRGCDAEGVSLWAEDEYPEVDPGVEACNRMILEKFQRLWESINGPGSWDASPWVWVVEFKRVEESK